MELVGKLLLLVPFRVFKTADATITSLTHQEGLSTIHNILGNPSSSKSLVYLTLSFSLPSSIYASLPCYERRGTPIFKTLFQIR